MNNARVLAFIGTSLGLFLAVAVAGFHFVASPAGSVSTQAVPVPLAAYQQPVNLGARYGSVTAQQLMQTYLENPPPVRAPAGGAAASGAMHFGGC